MIIERKLQNATWNFDTEKKEYIIVAPLAKPYDKQQTAIQLTKTEAFSLSRFLIRSFQKMSQKERKIKK